MGKITTATVESLVSSATMRNWSRLDTVLETKLSSRANKKLSKKIIFPVEYFDNKDNLSFVQQFVAYVNKKQYKTVDVVFSVGYSLLLKKRIVSKPHVQNILSKYDYVLLNDIVNFDFPVDESDILGIVYQCLLNEGEKNLAGAYYTCPTITKNMTTDLDFTHNQTFLDPCCGSGAFLLSLKNVNPEQLFGIDNNPVAVMITRFNLLLKFAQIEFTPQIECCDYLDNSLFSNLISFNNVFFNYIITNPPWGASVNIITDEIFSKESFSLFFVKAFKQIKENGVVRFLLPESFLNVKTHKDIRKYIVDKCNFESITFYDETFAGVTTKCVDVKCSKMTPSSIVTINKKNRCSNVKVAVFKRNHNFTFNTMSDEDMEIVEHIKQNNNFYLDNSVWALGIVTGDNKNKLHTTCSAGMEKIYTGKDITPYRLKDAKNYLYYDRADLQQVAKEEYYRAKEKLVYKFISNRLVFAYDDSGSLFLNSANILIPNIPNMCVKTVLAFLNSELYQYLYCVLFSEIKVLKGNLIELPFPSISSFEDSIISSYVDRILTGDSTYIDIIQKQIYESAKINDSQIQHIKEKLYGTFNK